jgi:poly(ADP-ribose) glycohydrolase
MYLGGGVMQGGGSQEESMFVEYTELLVTLFLVERMLPFEAVEITGARKYVEHNMMGAWGKPWESQFCRPSALSEEIITTVALDAMCFNRHGEATPADQFQPKHVRREFRKCAAALVQLPQESAPRITRSFASGLWGCGVFRGDPELKCVIQWICCSLEPSVDRLVFCPFNLKQKLLEDGLEQLQQILPGKVRVKKVVELLTEDPDYMRSPNTFRYILKKLERSGDQS